MLFYSALNTFIDDLFAFIIVMPNMHRLAVFRDDVIFLIFLYQRWIYPVDKKRGVQMPADDDDDTAAPTTATAASPIDGAAREAAVLADPAPESAQLTGLRNRPAATAVSTTDG